MKDAGKKIVNFAITNHCNAKCEYCLFHKEKNKKDVSLDDAIRTIDYLCDVNTGVLSLTGGEPLLNPDLPDIVKYARKRGLIVYTGTNSIRISDDLAKELKKADINAIWISFESSTYKSFNENRGVNNLHERVKNGLKSLKSEGLNVFAISLINKSITDFNELVKRLIELGFDKVKFDYPISFKLESSYKGWSSSPLLKYNSQDMETAIQAVLKIKNSTQIKVINPTAGLLGAIDFYQNKPPRYPCFAGEKILYLDWDLNVYRCPAIGKILGKVNDKINFKRIKCNKCYYQGVRDFDSFYYLLENLRLNPKLLASSLKTDEMRKLFDSLKAAWEIKESGLV
jgi:MoaA/NifB/PqqE/SkfB family radical SAM enzyme